MKKLLIDYYRRCVPYCFIKLSDERYTALNRYYKPLDRGPEFMPERLSREEFINELENYPDKSVVTFSREEIDNLKVKVVDDYDYFFLYDDSNSPYLNMSNKNAYNRFIDSNEKIKYII